jgi:hypothetical protein
MRITTTDICQERVMGPQTARQPSTIGNIPTSFAPILFADPSYLHADRSPIGSTRGDGESFIAKLGRKLRAYS